MRDASPAPSDASLASQLRPCGPVADAAAAVRHREVLEDAAEAAGWSAVLRQAWPALKPVFAASPYLAGLARLSPERLRLILEAAPETRFAAINIATLGLADAALALDEVKLRLRLL